MRLGFAEFPRKAARIVRRCSGHSSSLTKGTFFGPATLLIITTAAFLACTGFVSPAFGQIRFDSATPVAKTDAIFPLLADYQASIAAKYEHGQRIQATFSDWVEVKAVSVAQLFPELRFASISWSEHDHPASKEHSVGLALGLEVTLAVNPTTKRVTELICGGAYERFGKLLIDHAVCLHNEADAQTVWDAFCEVHHRHWKDRPMKMISASEWRLGIYSYDQTTSQVDGFKTQVTRTDYQKVTTDPNTDRIVSWESKMDSSNERKTSSK